MGARGAFAEHGAGSGLHRHDLNVGVLGFKKFAHARQGAAGAHARHKDIHLAVGIPPDLRAGGGAMNGGVGGIDKLAGDEAAGNLLGQLLGLGDGAGHALRSLGQHQLRAVGLQQVAALDTHGFGHGQDDFIAPGRGHGGQADVAAGGLNDGGPRLEQALGLRVVDHGAANAILHAARGVEILQLSRDSGLQTVLFFIICQFQKGGIADQIRDFFIDFHGINLLVLKTYRFYGL